MIMKAKKQKQKQITCRRKRKRNKKIKKNQWKMILKKKPNLLIFGSVALVVLLVGILVISMGKPSEKKAIERFEAAIKDNDAKELASMLTTEDDGLEITEENVQGMIDLFEANPSE